MPCLGPRHRFWSWPCECSRSLGRLLRKHCFQVWIDHLVGEIHPDPLVVSAVEGAARQRAMGVHRTAAAGSLQMLTVPLVILVNNVRIPEVPLNHPFVDI